MERSERRAAKVEAEAEIERWHCGCDYAMAASYTGYGCDSCGVRRGSAARTGTRCESHARALAAPNYSRGKGPGVRIVDYGTGASRCWGIAAGGRRARSSKVAATICWRLDPRLCK